MLLNNVVANIAHKVGFDFFFLLAALNPVLWCAALWVGSGWLCVFVVDVFAPMVIVIDSWSCAASTLAGWFLV